jgi:hypothetical protein
MHSITPPKNCKIWESEIATYWIEENILISLSKNTLRTVGNISSNAILVKQISGEKRMPLLIYLSKAPVPDRQTRKFSAQQLPLNYSAMAMVSNPGLSRIIMKLVFSLKPPPIPVKSFTDEQKARDWLKQFV